MNPALVCALVLSVAGTTWAAPSEPAAPAPAPASAPIEPPADKNQPQVYISDNPEAASIVIRDKNGKFIPIDVLSPEERAFRVFAYTEPQWEKLDAVIDRRNREIDEIALREFNDVIAARKLMFELDQYQTVESMQPLRELGKKLSPTDQTTDPKPGGLVDRLIAAGALDPEKRKEIDPVVEEYNKVLRDHWLEQSGGDETKVAVLAEKDAFANDVRDTVQSIDRQIRVALPDFIAITKRCDLTKEQLTELADVENVFASNPGSQPQQIVARLQRAKAFFYGTMTIDQAHRFVKLAEARRRMYEAADRKDADTTPSEAPSSSSGPSSSSPAPAAPASR